MTLKPERVCGPKIFYGKKFRARKTIDQQQTNKRNVKKMITIFFNVKFDLAKYLIR